MKRTKQSTFAKRERQEKATGFAPVGSEDMSKSGGAQFTPGPWEHRGNRVYRKDSYEVAWIAGDGPHSEWQANGKLIAAAPAMYEAGEPFVQGDNLIEVTDNGAGDCYVVKVTKVEYQALQAALAQAEGRQG